MPLSDRRPAGKLINVADAGVAGGGTVDDTTALAAVFADAPSGATVQFPPGYAFKVTSPITLTKPVRIVGDGATVTNPSSTETFKLEAGASGTSFEGLALVGPGSGTAHGSGHAIHTLGTVASPVTDLTFDRLTVKDFGKSAFWLERTLRFAVRDCEMSNLAYSGISTLACQWGTINGNKIRDIVQATGYPQSYGIALTRDSSASMAVSPRTSDIVVSGNVIDGVSNWEGIDTHGGERLTVAGNEVHNCLIGIAMLGCPNESGTDTYGPRDVAVVGNTIKGGVTDGSNRAGIQLVGAGPVGAPVEYATGVIAGNVIEDHGTQSSSTGSGIVCYVTEGAVVSGNTVRNPCLSGILMYHTNSGFSVVGNTIVDAWTTSAGFAAGIYVAGNYNVGHIGGNVGIRGSKTATLVNTRGIGILSTATNTDVHLGMNYFNSFATPTHDTGNLSKNQLTGKTLGFYGVTPVTRAAAIASPSADSASLKTAVDAIRTALTNLGLTS